MKDLLSKTQQVEFGIIFLIDKVCRQKEFCGRMFIIPGSVSSIEFEIVLTTKMKYRHYIILYDRKIDNVKNIISKNKIL